MPTPLRRLIDLPGVRELEGKALMNSRYADADARAQFGEIDDCSRGLFGLTADERELLRDFAEKPRITPRRCFRCLHLEAPPRH